MPQTETPKWNAKLRRTYKKLKTDQLDDYDTDYIDVDVLLGMYIDEFRTAKQNL